MKGLRYVIALFHVALIARANIENNNPGIIIVIMSAFVIIVNIIKSTITIIGISLTDAVNQDGQYQRLSSFCQLCSPIHQQGFLDSCEQ